MGGGVAYKSALSLVFSKKLGRTKPMIDSSILPKTSCIHHPNYHLEYHPKYYEITNEDLEDFTFRDELNILHPPPGIPPTRI
jgi:hypothetical protein